MSEPIERDGEVERVDRAAAAADTDEVKFWVDAEDTMGTVAARADLQRASEQFSATLKDGLEPEY